MDVLVSIVMPVYNSEKYIIDAIKSIQAQTYEYWELLAVDDCSSDSSKDILVQFSQDDSRIKPIFLSTNSGAAIARSVGIKAAQGRYLAFFDSDDIWISSKLVKQLDFMLRNNYAFSFSSYELISTDGTRIKKKVIAPPRITYKQALTHTVIWTSTVMLDFDKIDKFEMPNIRAGQDTATWLMLLKIIPCAYGYDEILALYRQVPDSISSSIKRRMTRMWRIYREIERFSIVRSCYYYVQYVCYILQKRKRVKPDDEN